MGLRVFFDRRVRTVFCSSVVCFLITVLTSCSSGGSLPGPSSPSPTGSTRLPSGGLAVPSPRPSSVVPTTTSSSAPSPSFSVGPSTLYFADGALPYPVVDSTRTRVAAPHTLEAQCWGGLLTIGVAIDGVSHPYTLDCDGEVFMFPLGSLALDSKLSITYDGTDATEFAVAILDP